MYVLFYMFNPLLYVVSLDFLTFKEKKKKLN